MTPEPPSSAHIHSTDMASEHGHDPESKQPQTRWQRIRGLVALFTGLAAAVVLLRQIDPHVPGVYPVCPTKLLTGLDCPGCGGLRATNELAHGDVAAALDDNALVVVAVPFAAFLFARAFYFAWTGRTPKPMPPGRVRWITVAVLVVLTVFTVVRNIPGSFLASG